MRFHHYCLAAILLNAFALGAFAADPPGSVVPDPDGALPGAPVAEAPAIDPDDPVNAAAADPNEPALPLAEAEW